MNVSDIVRKPSIKKHFLDSHFHFTKLRWRSRVYPWWIVL